MKIKFQQKRYDYVEGWHLQFRSYLPCPPPSVLCVSYGQICHFPHFILLRQLFAHITKNAKGGSDVLIDVFNPSTGIFTCFSKISTLVRIDILLP